MRTYKRPATVVVTVLASFALACGGEDASPAEEDVPASMEGAAGGMQEAAAAMQEAAEAAREAAGRMGQEPSVQEPINFRELQRFLPEELGGLARTHSQGETSGTMGMTVSIVEATYETEAGGSIDITITDLGAVPGAALMGFAAWANATVDRETDDGYERTSRYKDYPAYEEFSSYGEDEQGSAEFTFLVENRFMVELSGSDVTMDEVKDLRDELDIDDLADLKDRSG